MSALDTLNNIINNEKLLFTNLKYCLVNEKKIPFKINGENAKPNLVENFVNIEELLECQNLNEYAGLGISIQASNICAIDVDKCFSEPFNLDSGDERALDIIERFMNFAYIEFSFSGKGLRIFFKNNIINDYSLKYYIKSEKYGIEFYQPGQSYRYVTITGQYIINNLIKESNKNDKIIIDNFLNDYMKRSIKEKKTINVNENDNRSLDELKKKVRSKLLADYVFQEKWFMDAPGSNSNESETDFYLLSYLYENITQDRDKLRQLFETSWFFKTKDKKHLKKWEYNNYRYYNYLYERLN